MKRIKRELIHKGRIIDYYQDTIAVENGNEVLFDFIGHKGAAAVVPVREDGKILMVRQQRNALDRETLEIPAGGKNGAGEPSIVCAARELEEETGFKSEHLTPLISIYTTVAFCNEKIDIFVARDLQPSRQNLDEDEFIEVEAYDIEELCRMIYEQKIQDGKTVAALMAYRNQLK